MRGKPFQKICDRPGCGKEFTAQPSAFRKYCSNECKNMMSSKRAQEGHAKECANPDCTITFLYPPSSIQQYCSRKCAAVCHGKERREFNKKWEIEGVPERYKKS